LLTALEQESDHSPCWTRARLRRLMADLLVVASGLRSDDARRQHSWPSRHAAATRTEFVAAGARFGRKTCGIGSA